MKRGGELLTITSAVPIPYRWSVGAEGSRFLTEIRDKKRFVALRCSSCGKVYVPPRPLCGPCFAKMEEWVDLGDQGVLRGFSNVNYRFIDPNTGQERPIPFVYGYVRLDGSDTELSHVINAPDPSLLCPGMRVRAVFREERVGSLRDIVCFEVVG